MASHWALFIFNLCYLFFVSRYLSPHAHCRKIVMMVLKVTMVFSAEGVRR